MISSFNEWGNDQIRSQYEHKLKKFYPDGHDIPVYRGR